MSMMRLQHAKIHWIGLQVTATSLANTASLVSLGLLLVAHPKKSSGSPRLSPS